ncbi:hypothetical protein BCL90_2257 [Pedobacter alluvionis]|uniref:Uncharacterized protein n=1 Tax=Pedobacter alluvionis TaxID=475253 RepID=A0A497Y2T6_9SPHI|nr:hypothetical protein BCL90_2257 [Pedobacter alluvionis]
MKKIALEIKKGNAPIHLKSLIKKEKPAYLVKIRHSKIFSTTNLQLDLFYKSPI